MSSNASTTLRHPTPREQNDRLFNAVWEAIKEWDIRRSPANGYAGASGTDVCTILDAIVRVLPASSSFSKTLHELAGRPPDSPPQIVSAPDVKQFYKQWSDKAFGEYAERVGPDAYMLNFAEAYAREYASSSNAALQQKLELFEENFRAAIKRLDSEGVVLFNYPSIPEGCRSNIQWRNVRAEAAANEIHMLERAAESHKYTVSDLVAERDGLREALREAGSQLEIRRTLSTDLGI